MKDNKKYSSDGDIYLASDNQTLTSESPAIDQGLNPASETFKEIIGGATQVWNSETSQTETVYPKYEEILELLKTDLIGNQRIHNDTIDMGAIEFGSSK